MEVVMNNKCKFRDLSDGDCFMSFDTGKNIYLKLWLTSYDKEKLKDFKLDAINVRTGELMQVSDETDVIRLDCKLVVGGINNGNEE